jgi:hypothetical protein
MVLCVRFTLTRIHEHAMLIVVAVVLASIPPTPTATENVVNLSSLTPAQALGLECRGRR